MITEATLRDFKSWHSNIDDMRLPPITGLFGTNSSGKTSILQWLLMLKQTAESSDRHQVLNLGDDRDPVQLGSFRDVVHGHVKSGRMSWKLSWRLPKEMEVSDPQGKPGSVLMADDRMTHSCEVLEEESKRIGGDATRLKVAQMQYDFSAWRFLYKAKDAKPGYQLTAMMEGRRPGPPHSHFRFKRTPGRKWDLPPPVKCYGFPYQVNSYFQNAGFLPDLQLAFEEQMARTYYLGPLREYPQRQYTWAGSQPADMGRRGEKVIDALLAARDREKISRGKGRPRLGVEEYAAKWLRELKLIDSFSSSLAAPGSNLYQVAVRKTPNAAEVLITDVGFGISQILPVIVLCYYVPEGSTLILEQPEIHLHPSVQAGLGDVFIDAIKVRRIQIVLESHSEHLLRRLQRRIAEGAEGFVADDIALYFCEYKGGESILRPLEVDLLGNIHNWPEDFFGDELGEVAAMTRAQMEREKAPA